MRTWKITAVLLFSVVAAALLTASAVGSINVLNMSSTGYTKTPTYYAGNLGMMGAMMGGYKYYNVPSITSYTQLPASALTTAQSRPYFGVLVGGHCGGMRYRANYAVSLPPAEPLNITTAALLAQNYIAQIGNPNLAIADVEEYTYDFYVQVKEKDTGLGAFELVVDKYSGYVGAEVGPNLMWNLKYRVTNGHVEIYSTATTPLMPINVTQARTCAEQYLGAYLPSATIGEATTFYGYYTFEVLNGGKTYGLLSVNGYTGQVWSYTWHGAFIQKIGQ
jgi:hypothetical protein